MAARGVGDLNIKVAANTKPLADDLRQAAKELEQFAKAADRTRVAAERATGPSMRSGPTGAPKMATGAPRSRASDPFFADFASRKKAATAVAAVDKVRADAADRAHAAKLDADFALARQRGRQRSAWEVRAREQLASHGQPGAASRAFGWASGAAGGAAGMAGHAAAVGFEKVRNTAAAAGGSLQSFARDAASVATGVIFAEAGLSSLSSAFFHLKDSIRLAASAEMTFVGLEVLTKSADDARLLMAGVRQYAAATPFNNRELIDASRQLMAYGFTAEQVLPTLRMLGDVSAAMPDRLPIGDAAYLYGTLRSQGRAYARDVLQFSNRGISINEELAAVMGKQVHEVASLVEDGRVGFRDVERAFQRMTGEGGRFYGMTERQGRTAAASFEQLADAVEQLKIAFGTVLIEELDLRGAARDVQAFVGRVRDGTSEARPFVRQLGEIARGGINVGSEFARAAFEVSRIGFDSVVTAYPKLKELRGELNRLIADAQSFKLDERQVVRTGFALGGALVESTADATKMVGAYGEGMTFLFEKIVRSARQARDFMAESADWLRRMNDSVGPTMKFLVNPGILVGGWVADRVNEQRNPLRGRAPGDALRPTEIAPPVQAMSADRIREEWAAITGEQQDALRAWQAASARPTVGRFELPTSHFAERLADSSRRINEYVAGFDAPPDAVHAALARGDVPAIRRPGPTAPPDVLTELERDLARLRQNVFEPMTRLDVAKFRTDWNARLDARLGEIDARERVAALEGDRRAALFGAVGPAAAVQAGPPGPTFSGVQNRAAAWAAGVGGPLAAVMGPPAPREPARPEQMTLGVDLRRQFDPRVELEQYRRDLDAVKLHQLAGPATNTIVDRAWMEKLRDVGSRFGIGQRQELPQLIEAGSAEDARLINAWRTQPQQSTTDQLLQQILAAVQQQLRLEEQREVAPPPRAVRLPGD